MYQNRKSLYEQLEKARNSKVITYFTSDRQNLGTQIAGDVLPILTDHLDFIGDVNKISLFLYTRGGNTLSAWSIINLLRSFCKELEIIIPFNCHSAGTLICLGANKIVMTKQATLGPIDPSLDNPLNPIIPGYPTTIKAPVSVEYVNAYLEIAKTDLKIKNQDALSNILIELSNKIHPLVLGAVSKSRNQIKMLAEKLLKHQLINGRKKDKIISFLCSDSGSHDYTINRKEAKENLGLNIEKPTDELYNLIKDIYKNIEHDLELREPYIPEKYFYSKLQNGQNSVAYNFQRALIESIEGGSDIFISSGNLTLAPNGIIDRKIKEGWEHV
ncbi:MAG: hypothetical protein VB017_05955 [Endomicrobiaceae bacterium]|nr:hypothetical protein [Endomicrobiaceae bacterium]